MHAILFVDDEPRFASSIRRMLSNHTDQWQLLFAQSVDSALQLTRDQSLDLILADIKMSGKSGFELLQVLQESSETKAIPVVMISGADDLDLKARALDMGAADLLSKPVQKISPPFPAKDFTRLDHRPVIQTSDTRNL